MIHSTIIDVSFDRDNPVLSPRPIVLSDCLHPTREHAVPFAFITFTHTNTRTAYTPPHRPPHLLHPHAHPPTLTLTPTPTPLITASTNAIPHYTLDIALNYADKRMAVEQRVLLANPGPDTWDEIVFAVPPAYQDGVFTLTRAKVTTAYDERTARTRWDGTMLRVVLPVPIAQDEAVAIDLAYTINIPPVDLETWLPLGNLGAGERLIQAGDWHPTLAPYVPGIGWRTWDYVLVGDPNVYGIADYDVTIRADSRVVIAAPGRETRAGAARRYRLERARPSPSSPARNTGLISAGLAVFSSASTFCPNTAKKRKPFSKQPRTSSRCTRNSTARIPTPGWSSRRTPTTARWSTPA